MQSREKFEPRVSSSQVHTLLICAIELVQACYSAWTLASLSLIWRLMYFKRFLWEDLITSDGWKVFFLTIAPSNEGFYMTDFCTIGNNLSS